MRILLLANPYLGSTAPKSPFRFSRKSTERAAPVFADGVGAITWFGVLIATVIVIAAVALSGVRPKGARPVGNTHLMSAARVVLVILAVVLAYMWAT